MDLLVLGILLSITFSTVQGVTPACCVATTRKFPLSLLRKVNKYDVQTSDGPCEIDALVLYIRKKRLCVDPKLERILQRLRQLRVEKDRKKTPAE